MPESALESAANALEAVLPNGGFSLCVAGPGFNALTTVFRGTDGRGRAWDADTFAPIWSTTKGPAATAALWLLEKNGVDPGADLRSVWPEFPFALTFGQLLSHQAGLAAPVDDFPVFDHDAIVRGLTTQQPNWPPGTAHGYHPRSFGYLLDELSLRLVGERLGGVWNREFARRHRLDIWIGLPEEHFPRVAKVIAGRASSRPDEREFVAAYMAANSPTRRAFDAFKGLNSTFEFNRPEAWTCGSPAFGGVGSARGLATFYHFLAQETPGIISGSIRQHLATPLASGNDVILKMPTVFTAGCQMDPVDPSNHKIRQVFGPSLRAFGHPGAGGSIAFADPDRCIGVALVLNVLAPGIFPGPEIQALIRAVLAA